MVLLTELPPEIIQHVLGYVDPPDLAWIPRICKSIYHTVKGNASLFKAVYLNHYDNPRKSDLDWEQTLKNAVRLQVICRRANVHDKKHELPFVYETVKSLLENAATDTERVRQTTHPVSRNAHLLSSIFKDETNQFAFLCRSYIFERARHGFSGQSYPAPQVDHQQSAHLHCLYGVPMLYAHPESHRTRRSRMSPWACSKVYDLRQYTDNTNWGPFMDDSTDRVDWEKVEAIMIVIGSNLKKLGLTKFPVCKNFWDLPFAGTWPGSYKALPVVHEPEPLDLQDPYGITGTWLRVVCFLDYTDFFAYNFTSEAQPAVDEPRPPIDVGEATRLILMKIRVTRIEAPGPDDGQELPVVHFEGISRSLDDSYDENANSDLRGMRGSVRLTREGEVRWTTFSVFSGVERWRSESVQIGGVKSAKGVLGHWFDKDFDPRGPAGPTAFWKVSDKVMESGGYRALMQDFLPMIQDGPDDTTDFENGQLGDDDDEEEEEDEAGLELEITGISWVTWTDD
ncbi:uncharacterized protein F4807DRAFT_160003 [Annulohypoxylon truncatum]|uniref:uncharacterized protein n=1 Tax=Annulohypoxylon truncatum TaxID=327061 RepID=UPI002008D482|nr:uncharacterized protein F4807DRAFT_160003 [Annulohypoxylon truncatum]KAI1207948.1 hypothetical protein F4807DRAFT_160003 [Annulohypoxylon truncatum]